MNEGMRNPNEGMSTQNAEMHMEAVQNTAEAKLDRDIKHAMDAGEIPAAVQARLDRTYACFEKIPQDAVQLRARRKVSKAAMAIGIAAACVLLAGVAYAASNMLQMNSGGGSFFTSQKNLPVFDSMEPGAQALSAQVGQTASIDGVEVTLDEISCDRNVANLYLTLRKDGGFDEKELSNYSGSEEGEWAKLQNALPILQYSLTGSDGAQALGDVRRLDAYMEGDAIKCMLRIVPEKTMPTQLQMDISAWEDGQTEAKPIFSFGLDLENLSAPKELGSQDLVFSTSEGEKHLDIERFTSSELACVMVVHPQTKHWVEKDGSEAEGLDDDALNPALLKVADDLGNVLHAVEPGDGNGIEEGAACIIEYAGISPEASSVSFTPILEDTEAMEADRLARVDQANSEKAAEDPQDGLNANVNVSQDDGVASQDASVASANSTASAPADDSIVVDVSQKGAKIPLTGLGGYEVSGWSVDGSTVTISLKPYGWVPAGDVPELIADADVTMLQEQWSDPDSGQSGTGEHSAIRYVKFDYATGEVVQIDSYYKATQEELSAIHDYKTYIYPSDWYTEDEQAAKTLSLS